MEEVRYGVIGNVDSGKSTLIGVIVGDELDDGKGKARSSILRHPHEKKSGRTSSISQNFIKVNEKKYLNFIDLAGHEKYLKTTIKGITGYYIDYAIIVVGANMGGILYRLCNYCCRCEYGGILYDTGASIYCISD